MEEAAQNAGWAGLCHHADVSEVATTADPFAPVVGQAPVVARLRSAAERPVHAYLLAGPPGSGTRDLARGFAARLLAEGQDPERAERTVALVWADHHPDVTVVGAEGSSVRRVEAEALVAAALRSPVEGERKVLVGLGFDVITPEAAAILLKVIEEPPPSATFVLVAEDVPPELVTIASRCLRVDVPPLPTEVVRDCLEGELAERDLPVERAGPAAEAAGGDLDRARLLAVDERLTLRRDAWLSVPDQLDGTGAAAHRLVEALLSMVEEVLDPLREVQAAELAEAEEAAEAYGGLAKGGRRALEERHKRQVRRVKEQELRFGLALLARRYRDALVTADRPAPLIAATDDLARLAVMVARHNPNERLQLQALLLRLPPLG